MADTTSPDSRQQTVIEAIRAHHEQLGRTVADHALTIQDSIDRLTPPAERRTRLADFCAAEVLPHAAAEEETLYRAAEQVPELRLLVRAMRDEHLLLRDLVDRLARAQTQGAVAGTAAALDTLFQAHLAKENDVLLPALAAAGTDLGALLDGMHEILGPATEESAHTDTGRGCDCGGHGPAAPGADGELDVRALVPAQRHAQIFAAFAALSPGTAFVLVNDHDPKPLHYQFAAEHPGDFTWDYLEAGPRVWRVRIGRP